MKADIYKENMPAGNENEVLACVRYYARVTLLVKRNFEDGEFKKLGQSQFGVTDTQAAEILKSVGKSGESFGVMIARRFRGYVQYVLSNLRENFDCLLAMFWRDPSTKPIVDGQIGLWKANKILSAASRSARTFHGSMAIISEEDINHFFLKDNYQLVSDVWSPILGVLPEDFLAENNEWGKRFLKSTSIILS